MIIVDSIITYLPKISTPQKEKDELGLTENRRCTN